MRADLGAARGFTPSKLLAQYDTQYKQYEQYLCREQPINHHDEYEKNMNILVHISSYWQAYRHISRTAPPFLVVVVCAPPAPVWP